MKPLTKSLISIVLTGCVYEWNRYMFMAMNQPSTLLVMAGVCGLIFAIWFWCKEINYMWQITQQVSRQYNNLKEYLDE